MRQKKQLVSADGKPYTIWQRRTRFICFVLIIWALLEIASGTGLLVIENIGIFSVKSLSASLRMGIPSVLAGVANLICAAFGIWGAYNPRRITIFFWMVTVVMILMAWEVASLYSLGQIDPYIILSFIASLIFAVCAWNVRGQTGYFDKHPHPDDD